MCLDESDLDLLPEYCRYRDDGCEFADSCLNCPFPECIYAQPGGRQQWLKRLRDKEVLRLFTAQGKGAKELALMFGVSQRTIQRILKNHSTSPPRSPLRVESATSPYQGEGEDGSLEGLRPSVTPSSQPSKRKNIKTGAKSLLDTPDVEPR